MAYSPSVTASITQSTAAATTSNINNAIFVSKHAFYPERVKGYSSLAEVTADGSVPTSSNLYKALQKAFSVTNPSVPIYTGRQLVDSINMTPIVKNSTTYSMVVQTLSGTTYSDVYTISIESGVSATAEEICEAIAVKATAVITGGEATVTDNIGTVDGTITVSGAASQQLIVTKVVGFEQEFISTENGTDCFAGVIAENNEDYYFMTTESRDETFVTEFAAAVDAEATPKLFLVSTDEVGSLTDGSTTDLLLKLKEAQFQRTAGFYTQNSEVSFNELAACVAAGGFQAGAVNWKFLQNTDTKALNGNGVALLSGEMGELLDRNASWVSKESGLTYLHGGKLANGNWIDQQIIADWTKIEMEARIQTLLVNMNAAGTPITGTSTKLDLIKNRITSVLTDGVGYGLFSSYASPTMPTTISFEDQAARILDNITFTAYFAAKINFVLIDGNLTYNEEVA